MYPDDDFNDTDSRRTSFDEISVATPHSAFDSEPPAKRQRTADPSPEQTTTSLDRQQRLSMSGQKTSPGLFDVRNGVANGSQTSSGGDHEPQADVDLSQESIDPRLRDDGAVDQSQATIEEHSDNNDGRHTNSDNNLDGVQTHDLRRKDQKENHQNIEDPGNSFDSQAEATQLQSQADDSYQSPTEEKWNGANDQPSIRVSASREASVESSRSDARAARDLPLPEVSTDATPMATRQGSPATTASAVGEEVTPARSKPNITLAFAGTDDDEGDEGDDAEPATQNQDSMEAMEEEIEAPQYAEEDEDDDATTQKPTTKRRYAGGRRRAAHSNAYVEAAMRRQLELKQFYRQVTRAMKSCLGELAQITLDELATDDQHHTQVAEYESVIAGLDEHFARREQQLLSAQKFNHEQLLQRYHAESDCRRNRCRNFLEDIKEQQLVNLEYNMLRVNRAKLREESKPGHETEDEDGVIPRPKRMAYRFKRSNAIDLRYDSRSRFTMETERRVEDLQRRTGMWEALKAYGNDSVDAFTVMDSTSREAAKEKSMNVDATKKLAEVAAEYDRLYNAPVPPKAPPPPSAEELAPLNALADLAVKPALLSRRSMPKSFSSSSSTGYPDQPPHQRLRSPLRSHSLFDRGGAQPPMHSSPFLRLAMGQSRGAPSQPLAPSMLSSGTRQPETVLPPLSSAVARGVDGRPALAAKPGLYYDQASHEHFFPNNHTINPFYQHQSHYQHHPIDLHHHTDEMAHEHAMAKPLREYKLEDEARKAQEARDRAAAGHEAVSSNTNPCHASTFTDFTLQTEQTSHQPPSSGRDTMGEGPTSTTRATGIKREREEDEEKDAGRNTRQRTETTEEPATGRRSSAEAYRIASERAESINERIRQEGLMATNTAMAGDWHPRRNITAEDMAANHELARQLSNPGPGRRQSIPYAGHVRQSPPPNAPTGPRGPTPPVNAPTGPRNLGPRRNSGYNNNMPPHQGGMAAYPPPPPRQQPMPFMGSHWSQGYGGHHGQAPVPTAQPVNHFASGQMLGGPWVPPPPPPSAPGPYQGPNGPQQ